MPLTGRTSAIAATAAAALALEACGSGLTAHRTTPTASTPTTPAGFTPPPTPPTPTHAPTGSLTVVLKGTSQSSPQAPAQHASLTARLRVLGSQGKLCWTFAKVTGITGPTTAHINFISPVVGLQTYNTSANLVLQLGAHYAPTGCTSITASLASTMLETPGNFYLTVESANFPNQALHSLL
jgi:CHRD domain-containing protein